MTLSARIRGDMDKQIRELASPFSEHDWPVLQCPTCARGVLGTPNIVYENDGADPATLEKFDGDPTAPAGGFHGHLVCNRLLCRTWVMVSGWYVTDSQLLPGLYLDLWAVLSVKTILPAPLILELSLDAPDPVRREIERASRLIWMDPQSAVGALRSTVERVMDDLSIPDRDTKDKPLRLHGRLEMFAEAAPAAAELLMAVKWLAMAAFTSPLRYRSTTSSIPQRSSKSRSAFSIRLMTLRPR